MWSYVRIYLQLYDKVDTGSLVKRKFVIRELYNFLNLNPRVGKDNTERTNYSERNKWVRYYNVSGDVIKGGMERLSK